MVRIGATGKLLQGSLTTFSAGVFTTELKVRARMSRITAGQTSTTAMSIVIRLFRATSEMRTVMAFAADTNKPCRI